MIDDVIGNQVVEVQLIDKDTNVSRASIQRLVRALPNCKIEWDEGTVGPSRK